MTDPTADPELALRHPALRLVGRREFDLAVWTRAVRTGHGVEAAPPLWVSPPNEPHAAFLAVDPTEALPVGATSGDAARHLWRQLFVAEFLRPFAWDADSGSHATAAQMALVEQLGPPACHEARDVLEADGVVETECPTPTVAARALARVAELLAFDPEALGVVFPQLPAAELRARFPELDPGRLIALRDATRPPGVQALPRAVTIDEPALRPAAGLSAGGVGPRAEALVQRGNFVRAAILWADVPPDSPDGPQARVAARRVVSEGLVYRLAKAFRWNQDARRAWADAIVKLLPAASAGVWPPAARALYDLQRVVADQGEVSSVDVVGWLASLGRRPLRRPLPYATDLARLRHLRTARHHLDRALAGAADPELARLIDAELPRQEERLRERYAPAIRGALADAGLNPPTEVECLARDAAVGELIDRAVERGQLHFGDVRDVFARSDCKLPDVEKIGEWVSGDTLLRIDSLLAERLPGGYRRGEVYLRLIYRLTALGFATGLGRVLSRGVLLPAVGAFLAVEFAMYMRAELRGLFRWVAGRPAALLEHAAEQADAFAALASAPAAAAQKLAAPHHSSHHAPHVSPDSLAAMAAVALFLFAFVNWPAFRHGTAAAFRSVGSALRALFALPGRAWRSAPVRRLRLNPLVQAVTGRLAAPLAVAALVAAGLGLADYPIETCAVAAAAGFAVALLAQETPLGRRAAAALTDALRGGWRRLWANLVPGLLGAVLELFRSLGNLLERGLYAVDERLRYREGQGAGTLFLKALGVLAWSPVAYLVRFGYNLLLEPQINPVKHFPVVTVSHKLLLPLIPMLTQATGLSEGLVVAAVACVPGVFGFVVWELKENWRLYAANRPAALTPIVVGHHGETLRRYLRPGFHSGTVPKLFRRLRKGVARAALAGHPPPLLADSEALHAVTASIRAALDRHFLAFLPGAALSDLTVGVESVVAGVQPASGGALTLRFWLEAEQVRGELVGEPSPRAAAAWRGLLAKMGSPQVRVAWADWAREWGDSTCDAAPGRAALAAS